MDTLTLPPRLHEVLEAITDKDLAAKLNRTLQAAMHAMERLGHLKLLDLEPKVSDEGSADLALWESVAPAVRETVVDVNQLLDVIFLEFPGSSTSQVFTIESSDDFSEAEVGRIFRAAGQRLQAELAKVGEALKDPELVASRWNLLGELQRLRGGFRARIGDAVYLAAAALAPVERQEVVPGHAAEVKRAVTLRTTATDLVRSVESRLLDPSTDGARRVQMLSTDFDTFCAMPAWRYVRALPKRDLLSVRETLTELHGRNPTARLLEERLRPVLDTLREVARSQSHEVLRAHDRAAWRLAALRLEQAELHLDLDTGAAALAIASTLEHCAELYGLDSHLDALVRRGRSEKLSDLPRLDLTRLAQELKTRLEALELT